MRMLKYLQLMRLAFECLNSLWKLSQSLLACGKKLEIFNCEVLGLKDDVIVLWLKMVIQGSGFESLMCENIVLLNHQNTR